MSHFSPMMVMAVVTTVTGVGVVTRDTEAVDMEGDITMVMGEEAMVEEVSDLFLLQKTGIL